MDNTPFGPVEMDVLIAANQVEALHYRLYAYALLSPRAAMEAVRVEVDLPHTARIDEVPGRTLREAPAAPYADVAPGRGGCRGTADRAGAAVLAANPMPPALWSATVRALRERTCAAVEAQVQRFIETTGRDWKIRRIEYGEPMPVVLTPGRACRPGEHNARAAGFDARTRITLVTQVVLMACTPTLH
jgi:hypothetical protein